MVTYGLKGLLKNFSEYPILFRVPTSDINDVCVSGLSGKRRSSCTSICLRWVGGGHQGGDRVRKELRSTEGCIFVYIEKNVRPILNDG